MMKYALLARSALCAALLIASAAAAAAQDRGAEEQVYHDLGYGVGAGQAVIIIMPEKIAVGTAAHLSPTDVLNQAFEITGPATRSGKAGNCFPGEVKFQPARFVHRQGKETPVDIEVAVLFPDNTVVPEKVQVGSFRPGGPCGPGFQIQRGHIMNTSY